MKSWRYYVRVNCCLQLCYHSQKVHFSNLLFFSHRPSFPSQPVYPIYPYVLLFSSSKKQRIGIVFPVIHCYLTFYTYHSEFIFSKYHTLDRQHNVIKFSSEITQPWKWHCLHNQCHLDNKMRKSAKEEGREATGNHLWYFDFAEI